MNRLFVFYKLYKQNAVLFCKLKMCMKYECVFLSPPTHTHTHTHTHLCVLAFPNTPLKFKIFWIEFCWTVKKTHQLCFVLSVQSRFQKYASYTTKLVNTFFVPLSPTHTHIHTHIHTLSVSHSLSLSLSLKLISFLHLLRLSLSLLHTFFCEILV